jgi:hypothetical protein
MNKENVPYKLALELAKVGFKYQRVLIEYDSAETGTYYAKGIIDDVRFDYQLKLPFQQVFDWFEDEHNIYVQRTVDTSVNEVLDFTYTLKSWKFPPVEIKFEDPYDCFDRHKARIACLEKMIEIIKPQQ